MEKTSVFRIEWKYRELIDALGGAQGIAAHFEQRGVAPPPYNTVKGWRTRSSIPSKWAPFVILIATEEGILNNVKQLIRDIK